MIERRQTLGRPQRLLGEPEALHSPAASCTDEVRSPDLPDWASEGRLVLTAPFTRLRASPEAQAAFAGHGLRPPLEKFNA